MDTDATVKKVREFNRFYMPRMNLLGNHYLGSEYSATEARVLFEIHENEGCNAAYITQAMNIDKSYLSRIILAHAKNGYLFKTVSNQDRRSYELHLTEKGNKLAEGFINASSEEITKILDPLTQDEKKRMEEAMTTIMEMLSEGDDA